MKGRIGFFAGLLAAAMVLSAAAPAQPIDNSRNGGRPTMGNGRCVLHSDNNRIQHVIYIQFDNVHFRRDVPNVPSDLEQMSNLRNFLVDNGSVLTDHHTPLISGPPAERRGRGRTEFDIAQFDSTSSIQRRRWCPGMQP